MANTAQTDHATLQPWPLTLEVMAPAADAAMRVIVLHPYTKLEVRRLCHSEDMRTMCVSINGPGDPEHWTFRVETGVRVASKVGNLPSKFGHAIGSRIIRYMYATDGRTKATFIAPSAFPTAAGA